jgi:hypothetical protein
MSLVSVPPRLFGVVPPLGALSLGILALATAGVAFGTGHWILGAVLLGLGFAALALYVEAARQRPQGLVERAATTGITRLRERLWLAGGTAGAWSQASREVFRLRRELRRLEAERARTQYELGGAAYAGDEEACETLRSRLRELDEQASDCVGRGRQALDGAHRRVARERLAAQSTEIIKR